MDKNLHRTLQTYAVPNTQDEVVLEITYAHFASFEPGILLQLMYLEYCGIEDGRRTYNACNTEYFPVALLDRAIAAFDKRTTGNSYQESNLGYSLDKILTKPLRFA